MVSSSKVDLTPKKFIIELFSRDEWVPETRILKINPENLEKKSKLLKEHYAGRDHKKKSKSGGSQNTPLASKDGGKRSGGGSANTSRASTPVSERSFKVTPVSKKGPTGKSIYFEKTLKMEFFVKVFHRLILDDDHSTSSREEDAKRAVKRTRLSESLMDEPDFKFRIEIPEELKYVLVHDMDLVTGKKSLFGLPAKTTVSDILNEYLKQVEKNQLDNFGSISEVMHGLKDMFDGILKPQLLYKVEIPQFVEEVKDGKNPSDVYGSAHLLRLMVKIGPLLTRSTIDTSSEANVAFIENIISNFMSYLETKRDRLFTSKNYTKTAEDYPAITDTKTE